MATEYPDQSTLPPSDPASPDHAPIKSTTQARAGVTLGRMRWVLALSLVGAIVVFVIIWGVTNKP